MCHKCKFSVTSQKSAHSIIVSQEKQRRAGEGVTILGNRWKKRKVEMREEQRQRVSREQQGLIPKIEV